jgi:hypothetical protein
MLSGPEEPERFLVAHLLRQATLHGNVDYLS